MSRAPNFSIHMTQPETVLTLTHFELRVLLVNDEQTTFTTNNLTVGCTLL